MLALLVINHRVILFIISVLEHQQFFSGQETYLHWQNFGVRCEQPESYADVVWSCLAVKYIRISGIVLGILLQNFV